eukprot:scaffold524_cov55-Attheya_sp.AAC.1
MGKRAVRSASDKKAAAAGVSSTATTSSKSSSARPSNIKGGGRALLSSDAEAQLIDLLRTWRHPDRPLESNSIPSTCRPISTTKTSDHEQRRSEKVWCKAFLQAHERQWLSSQLNQSKSSHTNNNNNNTPSDTTTTPLPSHTNKNSTRMPSESSGAVANNPPAGEKVRLILVEAVHHSNKKQNAKNTTNNKDWKEGAVRKTVVLERGGGTLEELFRVSKAKLRLKKAPQRCFMMIVEHKQTTEIDISHLGAIPDGSTLYVSCHTNIGNSQQPTKKTPTTDHGDDSKSTMTTLSMDDDVYEPPAPSTPDDPLARVKQVYADRQRRHKQSIGMPATNYPMTTNDIQVLQNNTESNTSKLSFEERLKQLEPLSGSRANLPAAAHREEILTKLEQQSRVLIVSGQTGSGKSTQVPQYLLEFDQHAKICVTQPRRVAAMSLADRVSSERGTYPPGHAKSAVGYQVRLSSAVHPTSTRLIYCTVGILVRMLLQSSSPNHKDDDDAGNTIPCREWTHIVIDEVHERDVSTDFLLLLLKMVLHANPNVRLILMSATVSADQWVRYFASHKPQLVQIAGRTFPVQTNWLEDCQAFCGKTISSWNNNPRSDPNKEENPLLSPRAMERIDNPFICSLVARIIENQQSVAKEDQNNSMGAILIFLPGKSEIDALARSLLEDRNGTTAKCCWVLKLHSSVSPEEQRQVFRTAKPGQVKVVLATNVAETSITIPDVTTVIDTGRAKHARFNSETRISELVTVWIPRSSAMQRSGRAGRVSAGTAWRLYTKEFGQDHMPARAVPEILTCPLDELLLQLCLLDEQNNSWFSTTSGGREDTSSNGTSPVHILQQCPDPPPTASIVNACQHLLEVGALTMGNRASTLPDCNDNGTSNNAEPLVVKLTPLGYHLSQLPVDSKVAKVLIIGCLLGCVGPALTIASSLSSSKHSCFLPTAPPRDKQSKSKGNISSKTKEETNRRESQEELVRTGFGGENWPGGTVKGDLIGVIAAYNAWAETYSPSNPKKARSFALSHGLDHLCLCEMHNLRFQFERHLVTAGFLSTSKEHQQDQNRHNDNALLTSCCLVAGLYPNIATLIRPQQSAGKNKKYLGGGGKLLTKDGILCKPHPSSFQAKRVQQAAVTGKDAYVVFHAKHRNLSVNPATAPAAVGVVGSDVTQPEQAPSLNQVNFVSRFALMLFGGDLSIQREKKAILVDEWLKFKVVNRSDDKNSNNPALNVALISEFRVKLDNFLLRCVAGNNSDSSHEHLQQQHDQIIGVICTLLSEE